MRGQMVQITTITLLKNNQLAQEVDLPPGEVVTLYIGNGQSADRVDITIPSSLISRKHACIHSDGEGRAYLKDLGSTNGTFIGEDQLPPDRDIPVGPGTEITFGGEPEYRLQVTADNPRAVKASASEAGFPASQRSIFDLLQHQNSATVGRSTGCDIVIRDDTVSRQHSRIDKIEEGRYRITDLDSTNGTYLNGRKLRGHAALEFDDVILIGNFGLSLKGLAHDIREETAIRAESIIKRYSNGYVGLQKTSIDIPARSLLAIMGPSGCGKSTLMKALNGDSPTTGGRVFIHNLELTGNYEYLKPRIGYVPQDDIVHRELTVEKSLYFAAKLRMDKPEKAVIDAKIDQILKDLRIEPIRKNLVGEISGGQRKRVSIAVELLTDPLILFLDEPTSPLDPQTIEEFLNILRRLSEKGTTVIMVTHKPEDLNYMDSVIFMAEAGHLVFYGPTTEYKDYFKVANTVEVYANISGEHAEDWATRYREDHSSTATGRSVPRVAMQPEKLRTSPFAQFFWLTARYLNIKINDRVNTAILLGQAPIIALLLCFIFQDIVSAVPFLVSISAIWFGASNAAREIVGEMPIYRRERMFNLKLPPYILSKLAVLTLFSTIQAVLFIAILSLRFSDVLFPAPDPAWNNFFAATGWMLFLSMSASMMGLFLSSAMSTTEKVMTLIPVILIPQIMLAGSIAKITSWGVEAASWLTLARWGTEGLHIIQGKIYAEQVIVSTVTNLEGDVLSKTTHNQGGPVEAVAALNSQYLEAYSDGSVFGSLTNTLALDSIFIGGLGVLFFFLTLTALRAKDTL